VIIREAWWRLCRLFLFASESMCSRVVEIPLGNRPAKDKVRCKFFFAFVAVPGRDGKGSKVSRRVRGQQNHARRTKNSSTKNTRLDETEYHDEKNRTTALPRLTARAR
jgi:hypothetical protein